MLRTLFVTAVLSLLLGSLHAQTTYYSARTDSSTAQGGSSWTNLDSWTQDPSGSLLIGINIPTKGPGAQAGGMGLNNDRLVILSGVTIIVDVNNIDLDLGQVEVRAGGRIEFRTSTGHTIGTLDGQGTVQFLADGTNTVTLPSISTTNNFILAGGGTHEFGGNTNASNIPNPVGGSAADYNNVRLTGSVVHSFFTNASAYVLNGNLTIDSTAGARIRTTGGAKTITVNGDINVSSTRTGLNEGAFFVEQAAPDDLNNTLNVGGDFTTSGRILFTTEGLFSDNVQRTRRVLLRFTNANADQAFTTTGASTEVRLYDIGISKGTDQTYILDVLNTDGSPNWGLHGPNSATQDANGHTANLETTLVELAGGTIRFGPACDFNLKSGNNYSIPSTSCFWNAGANITVGGVSAIVLYGKFTSSGGTTTLVDGNTRGFTYRETGAMEITNGTVTTPQIGQSTIAGTHRGSFVMTGGTLNSITGTSSTLPRFIIGFPTMSYSVSGGTINVSNNNLTNDWGWDVRTSPENTSVTGGTVNILLNDPTTPGDNFRLNSTAPFYNLTISGTVANTVLLNEFNAIAAINVPDNDVQEPLVVLNNLTLGADGGAVHTLDVEGNEIYVGGNFSFGSNDVLDVSDAGEKLVFNGSTNATFTLGTATAPGLALEDVTVAKTGGATVTLASTGLAADAVHTRVTDSLVVSSGTLDYAAFRLEAQGVLSTDGRIGSATSNGRLLLNGTGAQVIRVSSETPSVFIDYLEIDNTAGVTLSGGAIDTTGTLELTDGVFDIGVYGVGVSSPIAGSGFSATKMIRTSGLDSDAGISVFTSSNLVSYLIPLGVTDYTPALLTTTGIATNGTIQVNVADNGLATLVNNNPTVDALDYYWRVRTTFSGAETIDFQYDYLEADVVGVNEATWVGGYTNGPVGATRNAGGVVDDGANTITFTGVALENARYTAGIPAKFVGSARVLYSYSNGDAASVNNPRNWNAAGSWIVNPEDPTNPHGASASPPGGTFASTPPTAADIVIIGGTAAGTIGATTVFEDMDRIEVLSGATAQAAAVYLTRNGAPTDNGGPRLRFNVGANLAGSDLGIVFSGDNERGGVFDILFNDTYTGAVPAGDFNDWSRSTDGIFLYNYNTGAANVTFTTVLPEYPTLRFEAGGSIREITLPATDFLVNLNMNVAQSTTLNLSSGAAGDITVNGSLVIGGQGVESLLVFPASANKRTLTVNGSVTINGGNTNPQNNRILVETGAGAVHDLRIVGNLTLNAGSMVLYTAAGNAAVNLDFFGSSNSTFSRPGVAPNIGPVPELYSITLSKDSVTNSATVTSEFVLNAGLDGDASTKALTLNAGTLLFDPATSTQSIVLSEGGADFVIPDNAELRLTNNINATITNGAADPGVEGSSITLNGKLRILGNSTLLAVGDSTGVNNATDRSISNIVYGSSGNAEFEIGGTAFVDIDGQFRRGTLSGTGAVVYRQTGGTAIFGRRVRSTGGGRLNQDATQGIFSIEANVGSRFVLTGGRLIVANDRQNNSFPDVLINTSSPIDSVTGGVLQLGYAQAKNTDGGGLETINARNTLDGIRLQATQVLPETEVVALGTGTNTLRVLANDPEFGGNLSIGSGHVLNTNGFTALLDADITVDGSFAGTTSLTFQGTGAQTFGGAATSLTLADLRVNKPVATSTVDVDVTGLTTLNLTGSLEVASGNLVLADDIETTGDSVIVADTVSGTGTLILNRTTAPSTLVGGSGAITNVEVRTNTNVESYDGISLIGNVSLSGGRWIAGTFPITLNANTTTLIDTSGTQYFELTASGSTQGFRLLVPSAGAVDFSLPIGAPGKYTPVYLEGTASAPGTYRVTVSEDEASAQTNFAADTLLDYHWRVATLNGLVFSDLTQYFGYSSLDVDPAGFESVYFPGFIRDGDVSWTRGPQSYVLTTAGAPNVSGGLVRFDQAAPSDPIAGTYTAGGWTELDVISIFYSRNSAANVTTTGISYLGSVDEWSTDDLLNHAGVAAGVSPDPNPGAAGAGRVEIRDGHRVNITSNNTEAFNLTIKGPDGRLTVSSIGNVLNEISGSGRLILDPPSGSPNVPSGNYSSFINDSLGTVEFTSSAPGGETYSIPTALNASVTAYHNLEISGSGTRTFDGNTVINGDFVLDGTVNPLTVNLNGATVTVRGNLIRTGTANLTGSGTIILAGTGAQTITGFEAGQDTLNNVTITKTGGSITTTDDNVVIRGTLTFSSDFVLSLGANRAVRFTSTAAAVSGIGPNRYIDGLVQRVVAAGVGSSFIFPVGVGAADYRPIQITSASDGTYTAQAFATAPPNTFDVGSAPVGEALIEVSEFGYWSLSAPNGASANIRVAYTGTLDDTPSPTYNEGNLRIAVTDSTAPGTWANFGGQGTASATSFAGLSLSGNVAVSGEVTTTSGNGTQVTFSSRLIAIGTAITPFPIELLSFAGRRTGNQADLRWTTASELNNDRFILQRSVDNRTFEDVGMVPGAGTTQDITNYTFTDFDVPDVDVVYYRLKQYDFDGTNSTSPAIELRREGLGDDLNDQWSFGPNPTDGTKFGLIVTGFDINPQADRHIVQLLAPAGGTLATLQGDLNTVNGQLRKALQSLPSGVYLLTVQAKRYVQYIRVVKE